ncbi:ABC transporter permease [Arthrobacter sp. YC-RL1]|nr:ABC transporter permease [Arthrobacter sp. YC-RL1]
MSTLQQRLTRPSRARIGREKTNWPATAILAACAFSVLMPLFVTVSMAFKSAGQAVDGKAFSWPDPFSVEGFTAAWELVNFPRAFTISLFITLISVCGGVLVASMASYAIHRNWNRKFYRYSFYYLLGAMFLPFPVLALSQVKLTGLAGLDNPFGVAILHVMFGLSFNVLLFTAFMRGLPAELEESARMDGASTWTAFWRIIFPLIAPMSATVAIFAFLGSWNDFMMPSLIIAEQANQTLPVVQQLFQTQFSNNYHVSFASYLLAMAPSIIAYLFTQRWVMSGLTQGAIK